MNLSIHTLLLKVCSQEMLHGSQNYRDMINSIYSLINLRKHKDNIFSYVKLANFKGFYNTINDSFDDYTCITLLACIQTHHRNFAFFLIGLCFSGIVRNVRLCQSSSTELTCPLLGRFLVNCTFFSNSIAYCVSGPISSSVTEPLVITPNATYSLSVGHFLTQAEM